VTPAEFAEAHALTLEEAELVLAKRNQPPPPTKPLAGSLGQDLVEVGQTVDRLMRARLKLAAAQKRVGVQPVVVEGSELTQVYDPDADVGKARFYEKKVPVESDPPKRFGDWEEPP
jgi:hypothetical protein